MWWSAQKSPPRKGCSDGVGEGVGQRGGGRGLAEAITPQGLGGAAEEVGGGAYAVMDRPAKEDEQGLREAVCKRRGVGVRCHDPPHDEAARPCLRAFHTASPGSR